ncbi:MAG: imidazole glycerol phosphate synthase subunit HisH [Vulcanimicrobiaceae bacterium]
MVQGTIAVIDYGGGNLGSLLGALERRGAAFVTTDDPERVRAADAAIFPGDSAFEATMQALAKRRLDAAIIDLVADGKPLLGICIGMQILFEASTEHGSCTGLSVFPGTVKRFSAGPRIPHIGWNTLERVVAHPFTAGVARGAYAYFMHSYRAPLGAATLAVTEHGERFASIVARGNVLGTQFHPEKSRTTGARLLDNFIGIVDAAGRARA